MNVIQKNINYLIDHINQNLEKYWIKLTEDDFTDEKFKETKKLFKKLPRKEVNVKLYNKYLNKIKTLTWKK